MADTDHHARSRLWGVLILLASVCSQTPAEGAALAGGADNPGQFSSRGIYTGLPPDVLGRDFSAVSDVSDQVLSQPAVVERVSSQPLVIGRFGDVPSSKLHVIQICPEFVGDYRIVRRH